MIPVSSAVTPGASRAAGLGYLITGALALLAACGDDVAATTATTATSSASVAFASPADGAHIAGAVPVQMTAAGISIEPAGEAHTGAGHFHIIADGDCIAPGAAIPKDATHMHYGKGQMEASVHLDAGKHALCLQIGDGTHLAQPITSQITVDVGVASTDEWCAVATQIDELTADADIADAITADAFAALQQTYADAEHLANQLQAGLDRVDAVERADVAVLLDYFGQLGRAITSSADATAASTALDGLFASPPDVLEAAGEWMTSTCGIDPTPST